MDYAMIKKILLVFGIVLISGTCFGATYQVTSATTTIDGQTFCGGGVCQPDDILEIDSGARDELEISDLNGSSGHPIVIRNKSDGVVYFTVSESDEGLTFFDCSYLDIRGDNYSGATYGFDFDGGSTGNSSTIGFQRCSNWTLSYFYGHDIGFGVGQNANIGWTQANSMGACEVHHFKVWNTYTYPSSAIYLGKSSAGDYPHYTSLSVHDFDVRNSGEDGIQVGQIDNGGTLTVYNGYIYNMGLDQTTTDGYGVVFNAEHYGAEAYNLWIDKTWRQGIHVNGGGAVNLHDIIILNAGYSGQDGIKIYATGPNTVDNAIIINTGKNGVYAPYAVNATTVTNSSIADITNSYLAGYITDGGGNETQADPLDLTAVTVFDGDTDYYDGDCIVQDGNPYACIVGGGGNVLTALGGGSISEAQIVTGGNTIELTIYSGSWNTLNDTLKATLIAGLDAQADQGATDWNTLVRDDAGEWWLDGGAVALSVDTITITLPAFATYNITSNETIVITIDKTLIVDATEDVTASPNIIISVVQASSSSGTRAITSGGTRKIVSGGSRKIVPQ